MASIRRKGRNWQTVHAVYVEGHRVQRTRNFASAAEARRYAAQMELLEQRGVGSVRATLGDYLTSWVAAKTPTVELNTAAGYRRWVGHIVKTPAAKVPLDRVTARDLEALYQHLLTTPGGRHKPLSPASVRHCHALLQSACNDAVRDKVIPSNPAAFARTPRGQSNKVTAPTAAQIVALLDDLAKHNPDLVDLARVIIGTGTRRSEALGLGWNSVDWRAGTITICQALIEHAGEWSLRRGTKSIAGQRTIHVAADILEALRRQQARVAEVRLKIGRYWRDHGLVFPDPASGGPRSPAAVTKAFTRAAKRSGWPEHSSPVHSLRHAAASLALADGGDLAAISRRLGHSSVAVTARIYIHSDTARDQAAAEAMASIMRNRSSLP